MAQIELSPEDRINIAMQYNMDVVVERYSKDNQISFETAKIHEKELKRFLALCAINPNKSYGMESVIDELWHTFIVFTREYFDFCQKVAGRFIHHIPNTTKSLTTREDLSNTSNDYLKYFGIEPDNDIWSSGNGSKCSGSCNGSCSSLRDLGNLILY